MISIGELLTALAGHPSVRKDASRRGWYYEIMPLTFDRGRIVLTDGAFVDDSW